MTELEWLDFIESEPGEEWRDVPLCENYYQVSDLGRVRCKGYHAEFLRRGTLVAKWVPPRIYVQKKRPADGKKRPFDTLHWIVSLSRFQDTKLKKRTVAIHELVCAAWRGAKPFPTAQVLHLDLNSVNNHPDNLIWGTQSQNLKMDYAAGIRSIDVLLLGKRRKRAMLATAQEPAL